VRFLYHIGQQSLPAAFVRIGDKLKSGNADVLLKKRNTVFMLEVLLQRHVYGRPLELKKDRGIRDAVIAILDISGRERIVRCVSHARRVCDAHRSSLVPDPKRQELADECRTGALITPGHALGFAALDAPALAANS
jgi:hypothetical protein